MAVLGFAFDGRADAHASSCLPGIHTGAGLVRTLPSSIFVPMIEQVAAGASAVGEIAAIVTTLKNEWNGLVQRHRLASDNPTKFKSTQKLVQQSLNCVDTLIEKEHLSETTHQQLQFWKTKLQQADEDCTQLLPMVQNANIFSQVRRAEEVLDESKEMLQQFFDFLGKDGLIPVNDTGSERHFRRDGTVPPNPHPSRLTLRYDDPSTYEGELKAAVCEHSTQQLVAVVATGRGGVGKSCAIRGLNGDEDVKSRFPGGVQFLQLGKDSGIAILIQQIARIVRNTGNGRLGDDIGRQSQLQKAVDLAAEWFRPHKCLFLVDDVWKENGFDFEIFRILAHMLHDESRLVFTTREAVLAHDADKCITFKERKGKDAQNMFLRHASLEKCSIEKEKNTNALKGILQICAGIPLLLAVTGAGVRGFLPRVKGPREDALSFYHDKLQDSKDSLFTGSHDGYGAIRNVVDTSMYVLERRWTAETEHGKPPVLSIREMHQRLCVLEKQQEVPVSMLQKLWGLSNRSIVSEVMEALNSVAVVEITIPEDGRELLRVHDDILDLLCCDAKNHKRTYIKQLLNNYCRGDDFEVETVLNTVSSNVADVEDERFCIFLKLRKLCCWKSNKGNAEVFADAPVVGCTNECRREWWTIEDEDGYLESNLCRLLRDGGEDDELVRLLLKPQWVMERLTKGGISAVESDVSIGQLVLDSSDMDRKEKKKRVLEVIAQAARLSQHAVARNPKEVYFQLYGRLVGYSNQCEITRLFLEEVAQVAENAAGPWAKARRGFLKGAGGAMLESFEVDGRVECIRMNGNELKILYRKTDGMHVVIYNRKFGSLRPPVSVGEFRRAAVSKDGQIVLFADRDVVKKWDAASGAVTDIGSVERWIVCICLSEDARWVACGLREVGKVVVWDLQCGGEPRELETGREVHVGFVAISAIGRKVVCRLSDDTIRIWNLDSGKAICEALEGGNEYLTSLTVSENGELIASGSGDGTIRVWKAKTGERMNFVNVDYSIRNVAFGENGKMILWDAKGAFGLWDHEKGDVSKTVTGDAADATFVSANEDLTVRFCGFEDGRVELWDARSAQSGVDIREEDAHDSPISCADVSADGRWIATGSRDGTIRLWDGENGTLVPDALRGHMDEVWDVSFSEDGQWLVSGGFDARVYVWDVRSASAVGDARCGHTDGVSCVSMCADGSRAASASDDGEVRVWHTQRFDAVGDILPECSVKVTCMAMSASGTRLAVASVDQTVRVWHVAERTCTHRFSWPPSSLCYPRFVSIHNASAVVWLEDGSAWLCSLERRTLERHPASPPPPWPSRTLELRDLPQQRLWLGTTDNDDHLCRRCKLGFCYTAETGVRFCQVKQ